MILIVRYFIGIMILAGSLIQSCYSGQDAGENISDPLNSQAITKIAVVDVQYILANSLAIKDLRRQIELITQDLHTQMTNKELELKKNEESLIGMKGKISSAQSEKESIGFNKKVSEAQKYAQQQKIKLEKVNSEGILKVHNATIETIKEVCKRRSCNIVLPSSQLLYADPDLNITTDVLEMLNKKISTIKVHF